MQQCLESASNKDEPDITGMFEDNVEFSEDDSLVIEKGPEPNWFQGSMPEGRRIVDISFMWNEIHRSYHEHEKEVQCSFEDWTLVNSRHYGLKTQLFFQCKMCKAKESIWSEPTESKTLDVNTAAVAGTLTAGLGYAQLEEVCAAVNIPCMSEKTYIHREEIVDDFQKTAMKNMKMAGEVEKQLAIKRNDVINGIPYITVVADGSWMKRSYGSAYDSPSGVGAIVGFETKKVLFIGVRNKYCSVCDMAERRGLEVRKHKCYKNFSRNANSTSMESDAIVEGFRSSIEMHGLIYHTVVADGDSNVYQSILNNAPYLEMNVKVRKIECTNHLLRNLCKKLKAVAETTQPRMHRNRNFVQLRKIVKSNILKIRKEVLRLAAVQRESTEPHHVRATILQNAILNIPSHIFGQHKRCKEYGIDESNCENKNNYVPSLQLYGLYPKIDTAVSRLSAYSDSLLLNLTNNPAESFNAVICKEIAGKRIHFGKRGSYNARIAASVVQYNTQQVLTQLHEDMCKDVPAVVENLEQRRQQKISINKERRQIHGRQKRKRETGPDCHYGPQSEKPDLPCHVFEQLRQKHVQKLLENAENRDEIECQTRCQSDCELWHSLRRQMLTASNFGFVCRMKPTTSCAATVKNILFPPYIETDAMKYGREMEKTARQEIAASLKKDIAPCGLVIDHENPFLGASPDGLIDEDGLVEIKCPFLAEKLTAEVAIQKLPQYKTVLDKKNPNKMNRTHKFFYQVQGQLNITRREYCIFSVWTPKSFIIVHVDRDEVFWKEQMLPFLTRFYNECMLPEILDSRYNRHMPIRNPKYILEAMQAKDAHTKRQISRVQRDICRKDKSAEQMSPASSAVVEEQDDCIIISHSKEELTDEDAKRFKKILDDTIPPLSLLEQNILPLHSKVNDESLNRLLRVIRETSAFETQSVQYLEFPQLVDASNSDKSIQIIGGNCTDHWRCIFFDGSKLHVYDSIPGCTYNRLAEKEKNYIHLRFPQVSVSDILFEKVQTQPDSTCCGIYAAAFATAAVALGRNPCEEIYSNDVNRMRRHLVTILQNNNLTFFPTE